MNTFWSDAATWMRREWLRYRRDRAYWVGQLVFPLAFVGFIGFGLNRVVSLPAGTDYVGHLAAGILALVVGSGAIGGGVTLIEDRATGFLRPLLVAPVSRAGIVVGKLAARSLASLALVAMLLLLLAPMTPLRLPHPGALALGVAGVSAGFMALGIALAVRLRSLESFRLLSALVTVPLYLLSGIFYPVETLPAATRVLASVNPLSFGVDLIRYGLLGVHEFPVLLSAAVMGGVAVLATWLAVRAFERET